MKSTEVEIILQGRVRSNQLKASILNNPRMMIKETANETIRRGIKRTKKIRKTLRSIRRTRRIRKGTATVIRSQRMKQSQGRFQNDGML